MTERHQHHGPTISPTSFFRVSSPTGSIASYNTPRTSSVRKHLQPFRKTQDLNGAKAQQTVNEQQYQERRDASPSSSYSRNNRDCNSSDLSIRKGQFKKRDSFMKKPKNTNRDVIQTQKKEPQKHIHIVQKQLHTHEDSASPEGHDPGRKISNESDIFCDEIPKDYEKHENNQTGNLGVQDTIFEEPYTSEGDSLRDTAVTRDNYDMGDKLSCEKHQTTSDATTSHPSSSNNLSNDILSNNGITKNTIPNATIQVAESHSNSFITTLDEEITDLPPTLHLFYEEKRQAEDFESLFDDLTTEDGDDLSIGSQQSSASIFERVVLTARST
eukprot:CAMPEP_0194328040 /NCGR_PEP_ID=MMETSP0171-20130528/43325_1 /TAXON_ID=218684 /ORGANISM="Corethron pennatum, Strain L29A3" /LENGTH=327 /DNA_ID=CAMNT_0039088219 /DNA_START=691 /DNA_END=1670 /DNA_ORIENTATION=-